MGDMRQAMLTWGAIEKECPICRVLTPVYTHDIFGGNSSVSCLNCNTSLQYKDGEAVMAEYGIAKEEDIARAVVFKRSWVMCHRCGGGHLLKQELGKLVYKCGRDTFSLIEGDEVFTNEPKA